jgi:hypothetical protein
LLLLELKRHNLTQNGLNPVKNCQIKIQNLLDKSISLDSIQQLLGYMILAKIRYSVLTTYEHWWVVELGEDGSVSISEAYSGYQAGECSVLAMLHYLIHVARESADSFTAPSLPKLRAARAKEDPPAQPDADGGGAPGSEGDKENGGDSNGRQGGSSGAKGRGGAGGKGKQSGAGAAGGSAGAGGQRVPVARFEFGRICAVHCSPRLAGGGWVGGRPSASGSTISTRCSRYLMCVRVIRADAHRYFGYRYIGYPSLYLISMMDPARKDASVSICRPLEHRDAPSLLDARRGDSRQEQGEEDAWYSVT